MARRSCGMEGREDHPAGWPCYMIIRSFLRGGRRVIKRGLTLAEAQAHCQDPQTSSKTATGARARRYTELHGPWFDGYDHR